MGRDYAENSLGLRDEQEIRHFRMGAIAAGLLDRAKAEGASAAELREMYDDVEGLEEDEKRALVKEGVYKWRQPWMLYYVVAGRLSPVWRLLDFG